MVLASTARVVYYASKHKSGTLNQTVVPASTARVVYYMPWSINLEPLVKLWSLLLHFITFSGSCDSTSRFNLLSKKGRRTLWRRRMIRMVSSPFSSTCRTRWNKDSRRSSLKNTLDFQSKIITSTGWRMSFYSKHCFQIDIFIKFKALSLYPPSNFHPPPFPSPNCNVDVWQTPSWPFIKFVFILILSNYKISAVRFYQPQSDINFHFQNWNLWWESLYLQSVYFSSRLS